MSRQPQPPPKVTLPDTSVRDLMIGRIQYEFELLTLNNMWKALKEQEKKVEAYREKYFSKTVIK